MRLPKWPVAQQWKLRKLWVQRVLEMVRLRTRLEHRLAVRLSRQQELLLELERRVSAQQQPQALAQARLFERGLEPLCWPSFAQAKAEWKHFQKYRQASPSGYCRPFVVRS